MTEFCHCEGATHVDMLTTCHCEAERSEAVAIAKSLELNGITMSCATPRNDMCHPEAIAEGYQETQPRPRISKFAKLTKKFNPRPQGVGVHPVSKAHRKELNVLTSYRLNDFKKKAGATHVDMSDNIRRVAFTLAEVLITLAIIGVVAAMTIPTLMANYQQKVLNNQFKKTYAMLNQALLNAQSQLGYFPRCYYFVDNTTIPVITGCGELSDKFWTLFKVSKICEGKAFEKGCIPEYEGMDTVANANYPDAEVPDGYEDYGDYASRGCKNFKKNAILNDRTVYVLSDGTIIILYSEYPFLLAVDINGQKGPNKWGHDLFAFLIRFDGNKFKYYGGGCMYVEEGGLLTDTMITKLERNEL